MILQSTTPSSIGDTRCNVCLIQGTRCSCRVEDFSERYEGDICGSVKDQYGQALLRRACERKHKSGPSGEESRFGTHPPTANIPKGSSGNPNGFIGGPYYGGARGWEASGTPIFIIDTTWLRKEKWYAHENSNHCSPGLYVK